jgi:hypothetical protein
VTPLEKRELYTEDWLGLKVLGERNAIVYVELEGAHMQFSTEDLRSIVTTYLGNKDGHDTDTSILESAMSGRRTALLEGIQHVLGYLKGY